MTQDQQHIIKSWKEYGVNFIQDSDGLWRWAETSETWEGAYSPPFDTFDMCLADLVAAFGPLSSQGD